MQLANRLSASSREETAAELMHKYDKDKDGSFSIDEVAVIVSDVQKERRAKKNYKKMACLLVAIVLFVLGGNAGLTAAVVYISKEIKVQGDGTLGTDNGDAMTHEKLPKVLVAPPPVRRRRLRTIHGRQLLEVAQMAEHLC